MMMMMIVDLAYNPGQYYWNDYYSETTPPSDRGNMGATSYLAPNGCLRVVIAGGEGRTVCCDVTTRSIIIIIIIHISLFHFCLFLFL
jgi:hypothetical protein